MIGARIIQGDAAEMLRTLPEDSVDCVVTSPPYYGLRDYGVAGQIGLEESFDAFLARLVGVFDEVRRVLKPTGTCWVNMGDSYNAGTSAPSKNGNGSVGRWNNAESVGGVRTATKLVKVKELLGQPWRLAFALSESGWYLRQDIIWHKPNPMPESIKDRCTKAHEYLFLLTKAERYFWNAEAMQEPTTGNAHSRGSGVNPKAKAPQGWDTSKGEGGHGAIHRAGRSRQNASFSGAVSKVVESRNRRSVWTVPTYPCAEAHFATFPPDLVKPCILAGCPVGGTVLDPFFGSGTTGMVALELGRSSIGIELNPEYVAIAKRRTTVTPGLQLA